MGKQDHGVRAVLKTQPQPSLCSRKWSLGEPVTRTIVLVPPDSRGLTLHRHASDHGSTRRTSPRCTQCITPAARRLCARICPGPIDKLPTHAVVQYICDTHRK